MTDGINIYAGGPNEPPANSCIAWCRDGKCRKNDPSITFDCGRFDHKDEHKGKFPLATFPPKKARK